MDKHMILIRQIDQVINIKPFSVIIFYWNHMVYYCSGFNPSEHVPRVYIHVVIMLLSGDT